MLGVLLLLPGLARADETIEVLADSVLSGNNGFVVKSTETGFPSVSLFAFEEAGKVRIYASRDAGSQVWDIFPAAQYLCPTTTMSIGNSWRFLDDDDSGAETVATVAAQEVVTTAAGTFSTFRVDVALASAPGTVIESIWFASGTGFVRDEGYFGGVLDWKSELVSVSIAGGTGYFPLAVGNRWDFVDIPVAVQPSSWGIVKRRFQ